jgi:glycerol uptake facilitator protein
MRERATLARQCLGELTGTFILVFFGVGSVHAAVLAGAQQGLWQVAVVWGIAISLAIYAVGGLSGAHLNPAMTVAFAVLRGFPWRRAPWYILSQLSGAILAAAVLHTLFSTVLGQFESAHHIVRGAAGSELSAMVYGEYFPHPGIAQSLHWAAASVGHAQAMLAEGIGTALLAFFVFAVTDPKNASRPGSRLFPLFIGLAVSILISVIAPLTQAGFNPARDFGPRLFAYWAGWGRIAIPGPRGGFFTVYILSPIVGAMLGAAAYQGLAVLSLRTAGQLIRREATARPSGEPLL